MDGGRVFRALLAFKLDRVRATEIAVGVGHAMALIFGAVGLFFNPFLVFIALFIWIGADAELQYVRVHAALSGVSIGDVMTRQFESIDANTRLDEISRLIGSGFQRDYPVMEDGRLVGFITLEDVARGLSQAGPQAPVGQFMHRGFETAKPEDSLEQIMSHWGHEGDQEIGVLDQGNLVGIVTPANIGQHLLVQSARARGSRPARI